MSTWKLNIKERSPVVHALLVGALVGLIALADYATGPLFELSIAYFIPIIYAATYLGRAAAFATAFIAEINTYMDQADLLSAGETHSVIAISIISVRLMIFLFTAEVTYRLAQSRREIARSARELGELNAELRSAYERLDDDVNAAGSLQAEVATFAMPSIPGCEIGAIMRSAGATGGDLVDVGPVDGGAYVCVADISGKGTPAALLTALLFHLMQESHERKLRGSDLVAAINSALVKRLPPERFVTLFYAEIDPQTGRVQYVNAGHPEAIICRAPDGRQELAGPTSAMLSMMEISTEFPTREIDLAPGDALVIYTDGATDSKTPEGERLGDAFIQSACARLFGTPPKEMAAAIMDEIYAATSTESRDDLSIVCLRWTGPPP